MKLIVDMNLTPRWADFLTGEGHSASHWSEFGKHDIEDSAIMAFARANDSVVLTNDLDFGSILAATNGLKPSVVQLRLFDLRPQTSGQRVLATLKQLEIELKDGALVTIDDNRIRLTVLPVRQKRG